MGIKAVIFDYGQVISLPQDPETVDTLAKKAGVNKEKFEPLLWSLRPDFDRGIISSKEYYHNISSCLGITLDEDIIDEMIEIDLSSWKNINAKTVTLMEDIKKAGYILGILSNMPHEFLAWARKNIPVFSLPQVSLFSCEVNLIKPEEAIYQKLLDLLGIDGQQPLSFGQLVFFDDNADNIESAAAPFILSALSSKKTSSSPSIPSRASSFR